MPSQLYVMATDSGLPRLSDHATVTVSVRRNLNAPVFSAKVYEVEVPEDMAVGDLVTTVVATDADKVIAHTATGHSLTAGRGGRGLGSDSMGGS